MKKLAIMALAAVLALSGCAENLDPAAAFGNGVNEANNSVTVSERSAILTAAEDNTVIDEDGFKHKLSEGDNTVEHNPDGYCGNTRTTISRNTRLGGEPLQRSFMSSDSVALTDLLRWLDYSGDACKCLPEYYVKTEFGAEEYSISLSEGYARYGGGQVSLTSEQLELIRGIIDRQLK